MRSLRVILPTLVVCVSLVIATGAGAQVQVGPDRDHFQAVDWPMVAKIREEGLQHSRLVETLSYMTDVLGARLTLSEGMKKAQAWAKAEMEGMGLTNTVIEPFMDYGVSWDNEYVSLHLLEPDYQPMVGYPLAHTPGTDGRRVLDVVIADVRTVQDLEQYRGRLAGVAVLSTPPAAVDLTRIRDGVPRRTAEELKALEEEVLPPSPRPRAAPRNPDLLRSEDRMAFYKAEGVAGVLEAARILKAVGALPRRTIRVALWAGEEQGLHGSREYVLRHFGDPNDADIGAKPGYEKFSAYFNQD